MGVVVSLLTCSLSRERVLISSECIAGHVKRELVSKSSCCFVLHARRVLGKTFGVVYFN